MEYDDLLLSLKRRRVAIAHAGQLPEGLAELQRYLNGRPEIWDFRFFRDGAELVAALEEGTHSISITSEVSHLLAVLPDDKTVEPGGIDILARRNNLWILMILGKALRSEENRRRVFYARGG